ncbi:MAG: D-alanyl-D-alanine carboxypeptidase family protein [Hyphomicrobiaceae bacterium]|nr:D-alanyl-D-alanine carboxypeptidase family protein [Hyphomicrobiaceae bacterium]
MVANRSLGACLSERLCGLLATAMMILTLGSTTVSAGPALLFDAGSGKVIYSEDMDQPWHPASLTKIMTAYLVFQDLKAGKIALDTKIKCTEAAHKEPPSKVGLPVGAELSVDLALKALIIKSANDVAVMLAEHLGPTHDAFIARMNATAKRLGMTRTQFFNPHGLPHPGQVTTARDLARLARAVVTDFPEHAGLWAMQDVRIGKIRLGTHNGLLKTFEGADGLKTGFICDSGYNVVASATRDGTRLIAVVLGEASGADRTVRAGSLLEHGFQQFGWKMLFNSNTIDNMPLDSDASGPKSVRHTIASFSCGNRDAARKLKIVRARAKETRVQKLTKAKKDGEQSTAAVATPAGTAAIKPAPAAGAPKATPAGVKPPAATAPAASPQKAPPAKAPQAAPAVKKPAPVE